MIESEEGFIKLSSLLPYLFIIFEETNEPVINKKYNNQAFEILYLIFL